MNKQTPEDYAIDLVNRYAQEVCLLRERYTSRYGKVAIQCAKIDVNNTLKLLSTLPASDHEYFDMTNQEYYTRVMNKLNDI
ncbi:hypothetical protein Harreka1_65 [Olleya phage Harreka_1]|uniref:Uncharacterized protein n=1 Tax=Olleya phage Harreka_1 TaxID=2745673 RepID=A0A8E4ZCK0_9CAUD|nr:hypothetical protein M1M26_gp65 [Olleya phage Harreka_1]QQV90472.1 hypothetical protein Harreka1_65 [Olleya phage Harreka_1]